MAPPEARNRLPPTAQYKVTIPLSKDGYPPPLMPKQPAHLDVIQQPSFFGPGFVTYRDEKTGKREVSKYYPLGLICTDILSAIPVWLLHLHLGKDEHPNTCPEVGPPYDQRTFRCRETNLAEN